MGNYLFSFVVNIWSICLKKSLITSKNNIYYISLYLFAIISVAAVFLEFIDRIDTKKLFVGDSKEIVSNISMYAGGLTFLSQALMNLYHNIQIKSYSNAILYADDVERGFVKK